MAMTHIENKSDFELCQMYKNGNRCKAEIELIQKHSHSIEKYVLFFQKKYNILKGHQIIDEFRNVAKYGLLKAADKYDTTHGASLMTYASKFIKSEILKVYKDYLKANGLEISDQEYKYIKKLRKFINDKDKIPSIENIADALSLCIPDTKYLLDLNQKIIALLSSSELYSKRKSFNSNTDDNNNPEEEEIQQEKEDEPTCSHHLLNSDKKTVGYNIDIISIYAIINTVPENHPKLGKIRDLIIDELKNLKEPNKTIITDLLTDPVFMTDKDGSFSTLSNKHGKTTRSIQKIATNFVRNIAKQCQSLE